MNSILQETSDFLKSKKLQPAFTEEGNSLVLRCTGEHLFWTTEVDTSEDASIITLLARVPVKVPLAKRPACAKLLARLNYGRRHGAFHLDVRDGEVLFCISNVLNAGMAPEENLETLFGATYSAMDDTALEILKLIYLRTQSADSEVPIPPAKRDRHVTRSGLNN